MPNASHMRGMRRICEAVGTSFYNFFWRPKTFSFSKFIFVPPQTHPNSPQNRSHPSKQKNGNKKRWILWTRFEKNLHFEHDFEELQISTWQGHNFHGIDSMKKWGGRDFQSKLNCVFDHLDSWKESLKSFFELVIEMEYKKINEQKCKHEVKSLFNGQEQEKTNVFALQVCLYYPIVMFNADFWVKVVCLGILLNERRMQNARHASQFATRAAQRCLGDYLMDVLGYVWWISQLQMVFFWKKTPKTMLTKSLSCVEWALGELKSMRWKPEIIHLEIHN